MTGDVLIQSHMLQSPANPPAPGREGRPLIDSRRNHDQSLNWNEGAAFRAELWYSELTAAGSTGADDDHVTRKCTQVL